MHQLNPDRTKLLETVDDAIKDIVSRPWFTRVWVYQELVLSNIVFVQVGRMRVPWDYLGEIMLDRYSEPKELDNPPKNRITLSTPTLDVCRDQDSETESRTSQLSSTVPTMREIPHGHDTPNFQPLWTMYKARSNYQNCSGYGGKVISFLDVLISRRGSDASDLRDIIYGHLAVADLQLKHAYERNGGSIPWPKVRNWSLQDYIPVADFTKSLENFFTEAARFTSSFRSTHGLLRILYHADVNASYARRSGLSSWVSDWTLDENSLQGLPWFFGDIGIRNVFEVTQDETWSLLPRYEDSGVEMSSIPVISLYPDILYFFYWGDRYGLEVVEEAVQVVVEDELAYISARQRLVDSVKNTFELTVKQNILGATDIYPTPPEDLHFSPGITRVDWLHSFIPGFSETFDPPWPDPDFLVNIITIALVDRDSLDIFREMKFARFCSGRVGVVSTATEPGDFTLTEVMYREGQNCCMFRPKEDHKNEVCNLDIRAEIYTGVEEVISVQHCTYLGKAWVEDSPSWRTSAEDQRFSKKRFDTLPRTLKIIAIH